MLRLTQNDQTRLQHFLRVLRSPIGRDIETWRREVIAAGRALTGAHRAAFMLPEPGVPPIALDEMDPQAIEDYLSHFIHIDPGHARRKAAGLLVCTPSMMYGDDWNATELYQDFFEPYGMHDSVLLNHDFDDGSTAWITLPKDYRDGAEQARHLALLRLALPAFEAGVEARRRVGGLQKALGALLDQLEEPTLLCDDAGNPLHRNRALAELLEEEPERNELERAVEQEAHTLAVALRLPSKSDGDVLAAEVRPRVLQTHSGKYRIRGSYVNEDVLLTGRPAILITVHSLQPRFPSVEELNERFGLTPRQGEVALLLAQGKSTRQIADELVISWHTARRHVENVMRKLSIHARAEVARVILSEQ